MIRLEHITALVLAAGLAIPSYWFFWTLAGGGGYEQRELKESYRAVSATPHRDGWGNTFNNILTEGNQVSNINSLMKRMKKVIK